MPRWKLANDIGVSEDTLERWESGKQRPDPDDVGNIERILKTPGLWHKSMLSTYDSYRERHTDVPYMNHPAALMMKLRHEMADVMSSLAPVERDSIDGKFDDFEQFERFQKEAREAQAALQQIIEWILAEALVYPDLKDPELMGFFNCYDITEMPYKVFPRADEFAHVNRAVLTALGIGGDAKKPSDEKDSEDAKN